MKKLSLIFASAIIFAACTNTEIGNSKDIEPSAIAQVIDVEYKEGEEAKSRIRFRVSGVNGTTLVLNEPATVNFNKEKLNVDSTKFYGAYYAATHIVNGENNYSYKAKDGKLYNNSFSFNGFGLSKPLPKILNKNSETQFSFFGVDNNEKINILISDTAKSTQDINEDLMVQNGIAKLSVAQLTKLKAGPIKIIIHYKAAKQLKEVTNEGGIINYDYALKEINSTLQ